MQSTNGYKILKTARRWVYQQVRVSYSSPLVSHIILLDPSSPMRAIVCGDSAGGNLSCAITVKALQEGILPPVGLLLHYPAVNLTDSASLSRMIFCHDPILNLETMRCVLECYLGEKANHAASDPLISPFFVDDDTLSQFPPTVISVGDVDPLIDDGTALFQRLQVISLISITIPTNHTTRNATFLPYYEYSAHSLMDS